MKGNTVTKMRKGVAMLSLLLMLAMMLSACAPGAGESKQGAQNAEPKVKYKIGIIQIAEHIALDEAKRGFIDGLKELGLDSNVEFLDKNAQGQFPNAVAIANSFVDEKTDLIYAIATPSAQATKQAVGGKIPVIFSAVTDPIEAGLIESFEKPGANITGVSDAAPIREQLELFKQIDPKISKIGILYSTSEVNSEIQINQVKKIAPELGLEVEVVGVSAISEISAAMDVLLSGSDAIYMITDNLVSSSSELVANKASEAKKIVVCAEENLLDTGSLITKSASYYDMGKQCAIMAHKVLEDKMQVSEIRAQLPHDLKQSFNKEVAVKLGLDITKEPFKSSDEYQPKK
ncbi:MAG: ABC transporter substrate-binding protein [Bacillota bacterium]|nr:ABC transporter substrate-binding protein [Bacillota bacterium]